MSTPMREPSTTSENSNRISRVLALLNIGASLWGSFKAVTKYSNHRGFEIDVFDLKKNVSSSPSFRALNKRTEDHFAKH